MKRLIGLVLVVVVLLSLSSCKQEEEGFWNSVSASESSGEQAPEIEWLEPDDPIVLEHKANLQMLYGEVWHSDIYNKAAIEIPEVETEETVEGELWFPPINNTASLEEIAPTISYELALEGYNISSYYPDNPEDYTAQALNENAFPIAFFRKVNDLYYYTVCKVEGGGYMYYFFMANSNVSFEQAAKADGRPLEYNADGSVKKNGGTYHLFRADLADLTGVDMTKEAIWRASIYSEEPLGTMDEFMKAVEGLYGSSFDETPKTWEEKQLAYITKIDTAGRAAVDTLQKLLGNALGEKETQYLGEQYYALYRMTLSRKNIITSKHLCSDGIVVLDYNIAGSFDASLIYTNDITPMSCYTFSYIGYNNGGGGYFSFALNELPTEQNSVQILVLPQDMIG